MDELRPLPLIDAAPLFTPLKAELLSLLNGLEPSDWERPTAAGRWRVHDVVAHLLDGELRTLAAHRDGHVLAPSGTVNDYNDVVALISRLNAEGVSFGRHLSPRLLIDLLDVTGASMSSFVSTLDPDAPALFAVAWAGEMESTNRFDTAREYTERWHHQMQIRTAVGDRGDPALLLADLYFTPLIETSVRVLPHAYRAADAERDTTIAFVAAPVTSGAMRGDAFQSLAWTLVREGGGWRLYSGEGRQPTARVVGGPDAWWRLFYNALRDDGRQEAFEVSGQAALLDPLWRARSVMV